MPKTKTNLREFMFVTINGNYQQNYGIHKILGLHKEDYVIAKKKIRKEFTKHETERNFKTIMAMLNISLDEYNAPILKHLNIQELGLLGKLGTKLGKLAQIANQRIDKIHADAKSSKLRKPNCTQISTSLKSKTYGELQNLYVQLVNKINQTVQNGYNPDKLMEAQKIISNEINLRSYERLETLYDVLL